MTPSGSYVYSINIYQKDIQNPRGLYMNIEKL